MGESGYRYEIDVARLLPEYYGEVNMEATYRLAVLNQTRKIIAARARNKERSGLFVYIAAGLTVIVAAAFLLWPHLSSIRNDQKIANTIPGAARENKPVAGVNRTAAPNQTASAATANNAPGKNDTTKNNLPAPLVEHKKDKLISPILAVIQVTQPVKDASGRQIKAGDRIANNAVIKTGDGGRVVMVTRRGAEVALDSKSALSMGLNGVARLRSGRLYCANRQGEIKRINTSAGRIQLLGTTLSAAILNKNTVAVTVVEGKVELANSKGKAVVDAGSKALMMVYQAPEHGKQINTLVDTAWYDGRGDIQSNFGDIAYTVSIDNLVTEIWTMKADGSGRRRLKSYLGYTYSMGSWLTEEQWRHAQPGEQWRIIQIGSALWTTPDYKTRRADTNAGHPIISDSMWLLNADTGQESLFQLPLGYDPLYTTISPDCKRVAFNGRYQPDPKNRDSMEGGVWVYDIESGQIKKALDGWIKTAVAWSPDNRFIAGSIGEGYGNVYPLVIADTKTEKITDLGIQGAGASFSPDGMKLAYCGDFREFGSWHHGVPTSGSIFIKDLANYTEPIRISPQGEGALDPRWSPDGKCIAYVTRKTDWLDDGNTHTFSKIFVAQADGSGVTKIYDAATRLEAMEWARDNNAVYAITNDEALLLAADGSGIMTRIPTDEKSSVLTPEEKVQTEAAIADLREAIFLFALGNVKEFEGRPVDVRKCFNTAADLFSGLLWKYPLSGFSSDHLMDYADKSLQLAQRDDQTVFSESCKKRMNYIGTILGHYLNKHKRFPSDVNVIIDFALNNGWGIDWLCFCDKEHVKMLPACPGTTRARPAGYVYHTPRQGEKPNIGDVLFTCPNHPRNRVEWDEDMQDQYPIENIVGKVINAPPTAVFTLAQLAAYTVDIGASNDDRFVKNWHYSEPAGFWNGFGTMRWSTEGSQLILPVIPNRQYTITIDVHKSSFLLAPWAGLYIGDDRILKFEGYGNSEITGIIPPRKNNSVVLDLKCIIWTPKGLVEGNDDTRKLGVAVRSVTMRVNDRPSVAPNKK
ncbi:MAG: FecR domain-containing protein [Armatimonadota bacterium]|nr:FecR domain-containing protein [Armatimonadota bacterium]